MYFYYSLSLVCVGGGSALYVHTRRSAHMEAKSHWVPSSWNYSCSLPDVDAGSKTLVLWKGSTHHEPLTHFSSPWYKILRTEEHGGENSIECVILAMEDILWHPRKASYKSKKLNEP